MRLQSGWAVLGEGRAWPILAKTATQAAAHWEKGKLDCMAPVDVQANDLRSVSGQSMDEPVLAPAMVPTRGAPRSKDEAELVYTAVLGLATFSEPQDVHLPVTPQAAHWVQVPGGQVEVRRLHAPVFGSVGQVFGPVLRLGALGTVQVEVPADVASPFGPQAALRLSLDSPRSAEPLSFDVPGVGTWARPQAQRAVPQHQPGVVGERMAMAHGPPLGFGVANILISLFDKPECKVLCDSTPPLAVDASYLRRFQGRSAATVRRDTKVALGLDLSMAAVALLSTLLPSGRHGLLSRWEILEDAFILGEGVLIAYTTPLSMEARLGRARPIAFHPVLGPQSSARTIVGPPLLAYRANRAGAWLGGVLAMLIVEDAPGRYTAGAGLLLGAMAVATAYYEIRAGLAYPTDAPLSVIYGAINGAGTVMWHRLFWGRSLGPRSDGRLRLQGVSLMGTEGGASASARLSF